MEKYLGRCIDSLLDVDKKITEYLDIIIVNDGSTDSSLSLAKDYQSRYPNSVTVIDKQNGHYGSCINAGIPIARGKYLRILDADDWFDSISLEQLILKLTEIDADVIFTKHIIKYPDHETVIEPQKSVEYGKVYNLIEDDSVFQFFFMHQITYRTELLQSINYRHTEGICYTDNEYIYYPLSTAKSIIFLDLVLYNYFVGRDDQSMSIKAQYRNRHHMRIIADRILHEKISEPNAIASRLKYSYLRSLYAPFFINSLCVKKPNADEDSTLRTTLARIKEEDTLLYKDIIGISIGHLQPVEIWRKSRILADLLLWPMRYYKYHRYYL